MEYKYACAYLYEYDIYENPDLAVHTEEATGKTVDFQIKRKYRLGGTLSFRKHE